MFANNSQILTLKTRCYVKNILTKVEHGGMPTTQEMVNFHYLRPISKFSGDNKESIDCFIHTKKEIEKVLNDKDNDDNRIIVKLLEDISRLKH